MAPKKSKKQKEPEIDDLVGDEPPTIDPYAVLGVEKSAPADAIKTAYRKAALLHHPGERNADFLRATGV
jgi:DnaJ homolog subfamily C member 9